MDQPAGMMAIIWGAIALALLVLAAVGAALLQARRSLHRRERASAASPKRHWHAEAVDPIARLRSPYKPEPMCPRCLSLGGHGDPLIFLCRLNGECGLLEDEAADRRDPPRRQ